MRILRDIATKKGLEFHSWSDDWIIELKNDHERHRIVGYRFGLNDSVASMLSQDKVATYTVLAQNNIPSVPHRLVRTKATQADIHAFEGWRELVIKPLVGTSGHGVRKYSDVDSALHFVEKSSIQAWAVSPYMNIANETRMLLLDDITLLAYKKEPTEINGLKMFNLGLGGHAVDVEPDKKLYQLAHAAKEALGLRVCSVDIVQLDDGTEMILEVNDAIMMEYYARQSKDNEMKVENVYEEIVDMMFM